MDRSPSSDIPVIGGGYLSDEVSVRQYRGFPNSQEVIMADVSQVKRFLTLQENGGSITGLKVSDTSNLMG